MTKILDVVKPGVIAGKDLNKVFAVARENGFAIPAVNCVGTDSINAVIEAFRINIISFFNSRNTYCMRTYAKSCFQMLGMH